MPLRASRSRSVPMKRSSAGSTSSSRAARLRTLTRRSPAHELGEQAMEVVHAALARRRVAASVVQTRANATLNGFDDRLVLALDAVEPGARALFAFARVPDEWEKRHARAIDSEWHDDVHGYAPWVDVEHRCREQPVVVRGDGLAGVGV